MKKMDHIKYPKSLKKKSISELRFIIKDAKEAATLNPDSPNTSYYLDEVNYCVQEINNRKK